MSVSAINENKPLQTAPVLIGEGGSKTVWKVQDAAGTAFDAIAKFRFPNPQDEEFLCCPESERSTLLQEAEKEVLSCIANEKAIMERLSGCPNVLQLKKVIIEGKQPVFVMDYYACGNLESSLEKTVFSSAQKKQIAVDLLKGLEACHAKQVFVADIKPSNVLLTLTYGAVLSDFGSSFVTEDADQLNVDTYNLFANVLNPFFSADDGKAHIFVQSFLKKYDRDSSISSKAALSQFLDEVQ